MEAAHLSKPIFVGRETELKELDICLNSAIEKKGSTVLVYGEAGTGKTRLIHEFLDCAKKEQLEIMVGWCLSNAPVPYFPFIEAFKIHTITSDKAKSLRPEKSEQKSDVINHLLARALKKVEAQQKLSPNVWKDLTFATLAETVKSISELKPTILFIDDLHWADSASLALLHYLSRVLALERVLIICTFRSEELYPNKEGQPHPLVETLRLMRREDLIKEIKLPNLSQPEVVKVAEYMAGGNLGQDFAIKLMNESQGNPLFVVESMRMLLENKHLTQRNGSFHLITAELGVPTKVKDIILRRLESLKTDQRRMLELASVIGEKFDPKLLGNATHKGVLNALETLNEISALTSLVHSEKSYYRFDHAKSREVLYDEMSSALKKEYHSRIAETIENTANNTTNPPVNELAYHYAQTDNQDKALQYAIAAGGDALAKYSNEEAAKYFTYVLQTSNAQKHSSERNKALEGLGDALLAKGVYETAEKTFKELANSEKGTVRLRALRKALAASFWRADLKHALEIAKEAEEYATLDRLEYSRVLIWRGRIVGFLGDSESAMRDLENALRVFEEEYFLSDAAQALKEAATFYATKGKVKKALSATRRAIAIFQDVEDYRGQMQTLMSEATFFFTYGLYEEALVDYDKSINIAEKLSALDELTMGTLYASLLKETMGDLKEALSMSLRNLRASEKTDSPFLQFNNYQMLTRQYAKLGDLPHAEEFHTKLTKFFDLISQKGTVLAHATGVYALAVFYATEEQWQKANSCFEESLQLLKTAVYSPLFEPIIKSDYAFFLAKQGRVNEAQKLSKESQELFKTTKSKLEPGEVEAFIMTKREIAVTEEFEVRLDIINISKSPAQLLRVDTLIPSAFDIKLTHPKCMLKADSIDFLGKKLAPFDVESIKFKLHPKRPGIFNLAPSLSYTAMGSGSNNETVMSYAIEPVKIIVRPETAPDQLPQEAASGPILNFKFETERAKSIFDFLLASFIQDYMRRRLPLEWSGWRTLMEIARHTGVSRHSIYGNGHSRGRALSELEHRGIVEARIFPKERGRGGKITKVRVFYEKETVKRRIDQEVSAPSRKNTAARSGPS